MRIRQLSLLGACCLLTLSARAAEIEVEWDLFDHASNTDVPVHRSSEEIDASSITFSPRIIPSPNILDAIAAAGWSSSPLADSRFFSFTLGSTGPAIDLTRFELAARRVNHKAPSRLTIRASRDGFESYLLIYEGELNDLEAHNISIDLSQFESFRSLRGYVEFRIYGGEHSSGSGVLALQNHSKARSIRILAD